MKDDPPLIKKRGDDGTNVITVRISEKLSLAELATASSRLSNDLISIIFSCGVDNEDIESSTF